MAADDGLFLLDWEWAGLYPDGYDLAFLWFVLIDLPDARSVVEGRIRTDPTVFWLSALLIELLHLEWIQGEFRPHHEASRRSGRKVARPRACVSRRWPSRTGILIATRWSIAARSSAPEPRTPAEAGLLALLGGLRTARGSSGSSYGEACQAIDMPWLWTNASTSARGGPSPSK